MVEFKSSRCVTRRCRLGLLAAHAWIRDDMSQSSLRPT
ncbi:hypothetical protein DB31_7146 [Hyalangium minutum]|uniref:Uncharacterized protein n=1 Tax=Hyalangium minutum TaxID=394096 RepID=A0A085WNI1_9BACT|nr:hypothetical protein DB31_7146 [Hyalangium minutum]